MVPKGSGGGVRCEMALGDRDDSLRLAQVTDPDGNVITFAEALVGH